MKSFWLNKSGCTGCGACSNICPTQSISMKADKSGFIYPLIGESCIDCDLCEITCKKIRGIDNGHFIKPITYAAWSKNEETRFMSTTGGVFSELVLPLLIDNGYVAGAKYNSQNLVDHVLVNDIKMLYEIRQSKYIQSNPNKIYSEVKGQLNNNERVIFCGAPCQVAGLYAYLGEKYDNLFTIDFICRGVNSPKAYLSWLNQIEEKEHSRVSHVWFKYKDGGWKTSPRRTRLDFDDGHYIVLDGASNLFMQGYLVHNLYLRPSCGQCEFKGVPRQGDITLADFWKVDKSLDDDKGTSMVLINSAKGECLFNSIKDSLEYQQRSFDEVYAGNICFNESVKISNKSQEFLNDLDIMPFNVAIKKYSKKPLYLRIRNRFFKKKV